MPRLLAGLQLTKAPSQAPTATRVYMLGRCAAMGASRGALHGASGLAVPMRDSRKRLPLQRLAGWQLCDVRCLTHRDSAATIGPVPGCAFSQL